MTFEPIQPLIKMGKQRCFVYPLTKEESWGIDGTVNLCSSLFLAGFVHFDESSVASLDNIEQHVIRTFIQFNAFYFFIIKKTQYKTYQTYSKTKILEKEKGDYEKRELEECSPRQYSKVIALFSSHFCCFVFILFLSC